MEMRLCQGKRKRGSLCQSSERVRNTGANNAATRWPVQVYEIWDHKVNIFKSQDLAVAICG